MADDYILNEHNKEEFPPAHTAEHLLNQTMQRLFGCERSYNAHIERKKSKMSFRLDQKPSRQEEKEIVESAQNYYKTTTQSATEDADKIIKHAQEQAEEMVQAHSITQAARVRAEEIKQQCQNDMNALVAQTRQDCEAHKQQAREWALGISQGSYNFVSDALGKYQNIAMNNLNEISEIYKQLQGGYESHMQSLQANPKVQAAQQPDVLPDAQDEE